MSDSVTTGARVREATSADAGAVAGAVEVLLRELGGGCPPREELTEAAAELLAEPARGLAFLAEGDGEAVGVLAASWQHAIHVPGRYATIQDLWVEPRWRNRGVGEALVEALAAACRERGVFRLEVGLPRESFAAIARTEAFYRRAGFEPLGPRMRRLLG